MKKILLALLLGLCVNLKAEYNFLVSTDVRGEKNTSIPGRPSNFLSEHIFSTLKAAQTYINNNIDIDKNKDDINICFRGGTYSHPSLSWTVSSPYFTTKITNYENEKVILNGKKSDGTIYAYFIKLIAKNQRSNIWVEGLIIEYYMGGIALGASKWIDDDETGPLDPTLQSSHNIIRNNVFRFIGNKFSTSTAMAYSALGLTNSSHNVVESNIFYRIESTNHAGHLHAIYIAHYCTDNTIKNNYVSLCSGDPFRIRNSCDSNTFESNYLDQSGKEGFIGDWYDQNGTEFKSTNTFIKDNICTFSYTEDNGAIGLFYKNGSSTYTSLGGNIVKQGHPFGEQIGGVASGDINGDGIDELFMAFNYPTSMGHSGFTKIVRSRPGTEPYLSEILYISDNWTVGDLEMNDFDNDGSPELITAFNELTSNADNTQIHRGDGINSVTNKGMIFSNSWWKTSALTSGDYNGNGTIELYTALNAPDASGADNTQIFKGNGTTSATNLGKKYNHNWWKTAALTSGDYNGDGSDDIFVAFNAPDNSGSSTTQIFKGDGINSVINLTSFYSDNWWRTGSLTSGDYNGDGNDEIVVAYNAPNTSGANNTQVFKGDGVSSLSNLGMLYADSWWYTGALGSGNFNSASGDEISMTYQGVDVTQMFLGNGNPNLNSIGQYYKAERTDNPLAFKKEAITTSITQSKESNINLYPNPLGNERAFNISGIDNGSTIEIYTTNGELIKSLHYEGKAVEVSGLSSGLYMLRITHKKEVLSRKLILR